MIANSQVRNEKSVLVYICHYFWIYVTYITVLLSWQKMYSLTTNNKLMWLA